MKRAGLFILHDGPFLRECEWLKRKMAQTAPGLPAPGAVAVDTLPQLLEALAAQIKQVDLFVVAAEPRQYYSLKTQLLDALGFPARVSPGVAALQKKYPEDTVFPSGATLFVTPEARYNGFAMRCGKQHMLVLPLRMDLLESLEAKVAQYLRGAVGNRVAPVAPAMRSVDDILAQMSGSYTTEPISPESIVPLAQAPQAAGALANRRAQELLRRLAGRKVSCDLLLPPAWSGAADFLRACGGGVVNPVFLQEKHLAGNDASALIARRMRGAGCKFCGMLTPPSPDGSHAVVALAGPGEFARVRRMDLRSGDGAPELTVALLNLLGEYSANQQPRTWRRRATRALAAGLAALVVAGGLFAGTRGPGRPQAQQVSRARLQAGDVVQLDSALLNNTLPNNAVLVETSAPAVVVSPLLREAPAQSREAPAPVAQAAADAPLSINPLDPTYSLGFGKLLLNFLDWLIGLLRSVPDVIVPPQVTTPTTTKAPTTADPATSTGAATTAATTSSAGTTAKPASQGTYSFSVAGFGHGVGLSQEGTKVLGAQGWTYDRIIKHYYNDAGIAISTDSSRPNTVTHGGASYGLKEYLARIAYAEIGRCGVVSDEAIKAQMVCAYTVAKKAGFKTTDTNQKLLPSADWNSNFAKQFHDKMLALATSVLGKYISYNGAVAETLYFASCAGYTASGKYAWGGSDPAPYLTGGRTSPETISRSYPTFTTDQIKDMVKTYNGKNPGKAITLGADASQWIKVLRADAYGYVEQLQIGDRTLTGGEARNYFFGALNLRSHNFTLSFAAK